MIPLTNSKFYYNINSATFWSCPVLFGEFPHSNTEYHNGNSDDYFRTFSVEIGDNGINVIQFGDIVIRQHIFRTKRVICFFEENPVIGLSRHDIELINFIVRKLEGRPKKVRWYTKLWNDWKSVMNDGGYGIF